MPDLFTLFRPLLFQLPPEHAHALSLALLRHHTIAALFAGKKLPATKSVTTTALPGLTLPNIIGLAAGADKNAIALAGWQKIGLGYIEVGTVTPRPQSGNPRPRMWRYPRARAIVNALGFPNQGADAVALRLRKWREKNPPRTGMLIGVNCGKQKETPIESATADYLQVIAKCLPHADFIVVNVSSPNTPGLRALQSADTIYPLVRDVVQACAATASPTPVWVKISPDMDPAALQETADAIHRAGANAIVATNTTLDHTPIATELRGQKLPGGLSGAPLFQRSLDCVKKLHIHLGDRIPIVGCGGISNTDHAQHYLQAGAQLLELYTGLIFAGPALIHQLAHLTHSATLKHNQLS